MTNNGMVVKFQTRCEYVFEGWIVQEGDLTTFWMANLVVIFYCMLHMNLWTIKQIIPKQHYGIMVMQLIMTMNGYVNIAVIIGSVIGYGIQVEGMQAVAKNKKIEPPPGGCEFCN